MKYSRQRELILQTVKEFPIHPTADSVYERVRAIQPNISLGTVYRNLNRLSEEGMLLRLPMSLGGDRYDGRVDDHSHILCCKCGLVSDIEVHHLTKLQENISVDTGYQITGHTIFFTGVCKDCKISL